jgi:hypothetical protein
MKKRQKELDNITMKYDTKEDLLNNKKDRLAILAIDFD